MIVHHGNDIDIWQVDGTASTFLQASRERLSASFILFFGESSLQLVLKKKNRQTKSAKSPSQHRIPRQEKRKARKIFRGTASYPGWARLGISRATVIPATDLVSTDPQSRKPSHNNTLINPTPFQITLPFLPILWTTQNSFLQNSSTQIGTLFARQETRF